MSQTVTVSYFSSFSLITILKKGIRRKIVLKKLALVYIKVGTGAGAASTFSPGTGAPSNDAAPQN
jgi:hypothetical protein